MAIPNNTGAKPSQTMSCPACGHREGFTIDTRATDKHVRRRRECAGCKRRYTTYERLEKDSGPTLEHIVGNLFLEAIDGLVAKRLAALEERVARLEKPREPEEMEPRPWSGPNPFANHEAAD